MKLRIPASPPSSSPVLAMVALYWRRIRLVEATAPCALYVRHSSHTSSVRRFSLVVRPHADKSGERWRKLPLYRFLAIMHTRSNDSACLFFLTHTPQAGGLSPRHCRVGAGCVGVHRNRWVFGMVGGICSVFSAYNISWRCQGARLGELLELITLPQNDVRYRYEL